MHDPTKPFNIHREDPQRKPPPGWKVENVLYQRLLIQAQRTRCQRLIAQVKRLKDASRSDLVTVLEPVSQAAKGRIDPETLDLEEILTR